MTESTDRVLASIDEAIDGYVSEDWTVGDDAMRWRPEEPEQDEQGDPWIASEVWDQVVRVDVGGLVVDWFSEHLGNHMALSGFQRTFLNQMYAGAAAGEPEPDYARARRGRYAGWSDAWRQVLDLSWCGPSAWTVDDPPRDERIWVEGYRPAAAALPDPDPHWDDSLHASLNRSIEYQPTRDTGSPYRFGGLVPDLETATRNAHELIRAMSDGLEAMRPRVAEMGRAFGAVGKVFKVQADGNHVQLLQGHRWHRIRCRLCNPRGNPKPLAVNGAEYRRRTRARRRRE